MPNPKLSFTDIYEWFVYHRTLFTFITGVVCGAFTVFVSAEEFKVYTSNQAIIDAGQNRAISVLDWDSKLKEIRADIDFLADSDTTLTIKERRLLDRLQRDEKRYEDKLNDS